MTISKAFLLIPLLPLPGSLQNKTRLLVTNQLQYLPRADQVIYLEDGRVAAQGRYEEVLKNANFASLLNEFNSRGGADSDEEEVDAHPVPVRGCKPYTLYRNA